MRRTRILIVAMLAALAVAQACFPTTGAGAPDSEDAEPLTPRAYLPTTSLGFSPLLFNPGGIDVDMVGEGVQRRNRIGAAAYHRANGILYVLELFVDGPKPVVHVRRVL